MTSSSGIIHSEQDLMFENPMKKVELGTGDCTKDHSIKDNSQLFLQQTRNPNSVLNAVK